jgi:DNA-binding NtrC family response regulator
MKILIIDLVNTYEYLYRRKLSKIKADVDFITKPTDIEQKLSKKHYDVLLISHNLKNSSGQEMNNKVRQLGYTGNVIIMTPGNHIKEVKECYTDITGVMSKSTNTDDFITELTGLTNTVIGDKYVPTT